MSNRPAGFDTEKTHYSLLCDRFGIDNVSLPNGSSNGSDFRVNSGHAGIITFESKSSSKDINDAGCISIYANGMIFYASSFLSNTNIKQIESSIKLNFDQIVDYTTMANTNMIPHMIDKELFVDIKEAGKIVQIVTHEPLNNIVENSFKKSDNFFLKANYLILDKDVYCISNNINLDPLNLISKGSPILGNEHLEKYTIRTARGGSKNGKASVTMRVQYLFKRDLDSSPIKLENL